MGNMKFKQRPREEQAETDGTADAENATKSKLYTVDALICIFFSVRRWSRRVS